MIRKLPAHFLFTIVITFSLQPYVHAQTTYWWNDAVFYEAFVRSFYDTNGDGVGDLQGLTEKLGYLQDLGVNAIWLMPVCASPSYHGYDVTNYKSIQPAYGTKQQYLNFVDSAHSRGIKVIFDFVMNHTSSSHPWFQQSEANDLQYKDFYEWSLTNPGNTGPWGQQVWYYHNSTVGYYYGLFWSGMPDLNYNNQAVHDSMFSAAEFWLDSMHVDGFRLDAAPYLYDDCPQLTSCNGTFQFWQDFHTFYKNINDSAMTVGEVWYPTNTILPYVNGGDKLDFCFEFDLATSMINSVNTASAAGLKSALQYDYDHYPYLQFGTFLTNHDQNRVLDDVSGNLSKMKALAAMYLTIPGIPFIYYGEEIGMTGSGADENKRRPMQWTSGAHAGFTTGNPWEAINNNYVTNNVETESADGNSLLNWYKKLIALRHQEPALRRGNYIAVASAPSGIFSFIRTYANDTDLVIINVANQTLTNFSINVGAGNLSPGYKLFSDLLDGGAYVGSLDGANNLGVFTIAPFGTLVYRLESSTGVAPIFENQALTIFPNPANDVISMELKKEVRHPVSVSIQDEQGRILQLQQLNPVNGKLNIDVSTLPNGVYFIKLNDDDATGYFKVEVIH